MRIDATVGSVPCFHQCTKQSKFRIKIVDSWYGYTEAFKIAHVCTLNVPMFANHQQFGVILRVGLLDRGAFIREGRLTAQRWRLLDKRRLFGSVLLLGHLLHKRFKRCSTSKILPYEDSSLVSKNIRVLTQRIRIVFACPHENAKTMEIP